MKTKLLLDEDVHLVLANVLRQRGYDAVHVQEIGRKGKSDPEQLAYAVAEGRCMMTFNIRDYAQLHVVYFSEAREHKSIVVSNQHPVGEVLRRLILVLTRFSDEDMKNRLEYL